MLSLLLLVALALATVGEPAAAATGGAGVTARLKQTLIRQIGQRLERRAYAHGVDFGAWPELLAE